MLIVAMLWSEPKTPRVGAITVYPTRPVCDRMAAKLLHFVEILRYNTAIKTTSACINRLQKMKNKDQHLIIVLRTTRATLDRTWHVRFGVNHVIKYKRG